jgi:hypothetical protein
LLGSKSIDDVRDIRDMVDERGADPMPTTLTLRRRVCFLARDAQFGRSAFLPQQAPSRGTGRALSARG